MSEKEAEERGRGGEGKFTFSTSGPLGVEDGRQWGYMVRVGKTKNY